MKVNKKAVVAASLLIIIAFIVLVAVVYILKRSQAPIHDLSITRISSTARDIYIGSTLNVTVTVKNEGTVYETFNITLYSNEDIIGIYEGVGLNPGAVKDIVFKWNTTGLIPANYLLKAKVSVVEGETDSSDNICIGDYIRVREKPTELATLYLNPANVSVGFYQTFIVDIVISEVADLFGYELRLSWNATMLDMIDIDEGPFLKQGGDTFFTYKLNETEGSLIIDCTLLGDKPGSSGNGTLVTLEFKAKETGKCTISFSQIKLISSLEKPMAYKAKNCDVLVYPP